MPFRKAANSNSEGESSDPQTSSFFVSLSKLSLPFFSRGSGGDIPEPDKPTMPKNSDEVITMIQQYKPYVKKFTFGSFVGYCSGVAAKRVGKALAFLTGVGFIVVQSAVYSGFVQVDWEKVQNSAIQAVDTDADGEITEKDLVRYWGKVKAILTKNLPDAGGFSLGFLYGLAD